MNETFPVLYILGRTDLGSLNTGKFGAQTSHASNAFVKHFHDLTDGNEDNFTMRELFDKWENTSSQGFGTVLTLAVNEMQMRFAVGAAERYGLLSGIVHDDTYPILVDRDLTNWWHSKFDPEIMHGLAVGDGYVTVTMDTCAYVFADKNDPYTSMLLGGYKLHP